MPDRVLIPIHNRQGNLVAYLGRAIDPREPRRQFPPGFQKSLVWFNLHRALQSGSREGIVVEGFFDCLRVHQSGFASVVALRGSSLTPAQQELLLAHFEEVALLLDGGQTGPQATRRIAAQLRARIALPTVEVPASQPPDQLRAREIGRLREQPRADRNV